MNKKNKKVWITVALIVIIYIVVMRPIIADSDAQLNPSGKSPKVVATEEGEENSSENSKRTATATNRLIFITGAVEAPGLYEVQDGATWGDVIKLCGGFLPYAAVDTLNLAETAEIGVHVHVPFNFSGNPEVLLQKKKVNINTADENGLTALNGVGPGTAKKIIDYRNTNGSFSSIEDLKKVKGIGEATFKKLAPHITI